MARSHVNTGIKAKIVAENRKARYEFFIDEVVEAGIALAGTEVKALRQGEGSIAESYAELKDGQMWLVNANIPEFSHGNRNNHEPKRPRKLLMHAKQISKFNGAVTRQGMTVIPLMIYFNDRGRAKVELAL
ncbi:MAG: SsrA-binding protein SmpB, partial [Janthinobacterium lividum]